MEICIFDVDRGSCALVTGDDREMMLVGCGRNGDDRFRPSTYLSRYGVTALQKLIVSTYHEDHVSDLPELHRNVEIRGVRRNRGIPLHELRRLSAKANGVGPGLTYYFEMMERFPPGGATPPALDGIQERYFSNGYPTFSDPGNLSLVSFLRYRDIHILFPGDLGPESCRMLLDEPEFRRELKTVNLFVAPCGGRENGYCPELFEHCAPSLVIVAGGMGRESRQANGYGRHTRGLRIGDRERHVVSTSSDGIIRISQGPFDPAIIQTSAETGVL